MTVNIGATEHHQFYGDDSTGSVLSSLATDDSGNADFTVGTGCIYSTAFAQGDPCTYMVDFELRLGVNPAGYVLSRYSGTTSLGVRYNGANGLQLVVNNSVVQTLGIGATGGRMILSWALEDDPLNSGSTRSMVRVWDQATGNLLDGIDWTHTDPDSAGEDFIIGAQVTAGTNSAGAALYGAGFLLHATSERQVFRDRLTAAAAPAISGDTAMEVPMSSSLTVFGQQDSAAGPTHWVGGGAVAQNRLLTASPLVNLQWDLSGAAGSHQYTLMSTSAWFTAPPEGSGFLGLHWTWRRPVPRTVNRVRVRAFVTSGNSDDLAIENSVTLTAWSCNRNPGVVSETLLDYRSNSASFGPVNDVTTGSDGRWLDVGDINIVRTPNQANTWLSLSVEITGPSASGQRFDVLAIVIEPWSETSTDADATEGFG